MNYIIVKNASQEVWHLYFDSDSIPGVDRYFREYKFTVRFVSDL